MAVEIRSTLYLYIHLHQIWKCFNCVGDTAAPSRIITVIQYSVYLLLHIKYDSNGVCTIGNSNIELLIINFGTKLPKMYHLCGCLMKFGGSKHARMIDSTFNKCYR
jgi:hypothetical protein